MVIRRKQSIYGIKPDIDVILEPQPGQAELGAKMRAALAAGWSRTFSGTGTQIQWAVPGQFNLSLRMCSLNGMGKESIPRLFTMQLNDQIWAVGIPDPPGDTGILVNVDHLNEAGLAVEKAFVDTDQLIDYAKKLAQYDTNGI